MLGLSRQEIDGNVRLPQHILAVRQRLLWRISRGRAFEGCAAHSRLKNLGQFKLCPGFFGDVPDACKGKIRDMSGDRFDFLVAVA